MRIALRAAAVFAVLAAALSVMPTTASAAAGGSFRQQPGPTSDKPVPVPPAATPGTGTASKLPPKPARTSESITTAAWTVTLSFTSNYLWPTQYTTLTATTNQDVGPTPYYIRIWDAKTNVFVATCGSGTTCSASVTKPTITLDTFWGVVGAIGAPYLSVSLRDIYWHGADLSLSASPTTLVVNGTTTVTAATVLDIGSSPFYTQIFDATTGIRLRVCGVGTSCSVAVSQAAATTHTYRAYLSSNSATFPPAGIQETSSASFVTWSNTGWHVSLSQPPLSMSTVTVTATASADVGPTPYYIEIFNENGTRLAYCGSGTSCTVTFQPTQYKTYLVAFISSYSTVLPPAGTQASSNVVTALYVEPPH